ncbi:MAG: methyltransferase [Prevotella sp.]|nr:methyltransferase [Prevotella sp.]MCM1075095.1 methyltransferase [Ruminococcus sp.]
MKQRVFKFKKFTVAHGCSSLPVGFDAVLLGAWTDVSGAESILDVGCGCGVIALMCAQKNQSAIIHAIDIHAPSVAEAEYNFQNSPWSDRLTASFSDFNLLAKEGRGIDLIISNPPFFNAGVKQVNENARLQARHAAEFSPQSLITHGAESLSEKGSIALIFPPEEELALLHIANGVGLFARRICRVFSRNQEAPVRVMMQLSKHYCDCDIMKLRIYAQGGEYSSEYKKLTKDFHLNS